MTESTKCDWCGMSEDACWDRRNGTICPEWAGPDEREDETMKTYSVNLWGSNPDETDNDDCWTGRDYVTRDEAVAAYQAIYKWPDAPFGNPRFADFEFCVIDGPDVHEVMPNPDQKSQARRRREAARSDAEERSERAMQAGMAFGVDGYNDEMGY